MLEKSTEKLVQLYEKKRELERINQIFKEIKNELTKEKEKNRELKGLLEKEFKDVKRLETTTLHNLFYSVLGTKTQMLEKENGEYLAVSLKFKESEEAVKSLSDDVALYSQKIYGQNQIDLEIDKAIIEIKNQFSEEIHGNYKNILNQIENNVKYKSEIKEIREAISAGNDSLKSIEDVEAALKKAENWGVIDLIGGGFVTTAIKKSWVDSAKFYATKAQNQLRRFKRELNDIDISENIAIETNSLLTFADFFIDGLIIDWVAQSKIQTALNNVMSAKGKLKNTINSLNNRLNEKENSRDKSNVEIDNLINEYIK